MLQDGLIENIWNSAIETRQPVRPDYTFTHKFGIEIEAYNCSMSRLADELRGAGSTMIARIGNIWRTLPSVT